MKTALLFIDVQNGLVSAKPHAIDETIGVWQKALTWAREANVPVVFVRQTDDYFVAGSEAWQISSALTLTEQDRIIDKHYNSAFKDTELHSYLQELGVERLIIAGMRTEYCVAATVTVAFELGYEVVVLEGGTTTFNSDGISAPALIEHYENLWADCFAEVDFLEEFMEEEKT